MTKKSTNAISNRTGRSPMRAFLAHSALLLAAFLLAGSLGAQAPAGNVLAFNAAELDFAIATNVPGLPGAFTVETYMLYEGPIPGVSGSSYPCLWQLQDADDVGGYPTSIFLLGNANSFQLEFWDGVRLSGATVQGSNCQWYHVAYVWNGTTGTSYFNGVAVATHNTQNNVFTGGVLRIGRDGPNDGSGANDWPFNGRLDEFRVSNIARYTANFTPPTGELPTDANTVAHYRFDEAPGSLTAADASGNGATLQMGATAAAATDDPAFVPASSQPAGCETPAEALDFDGVNDFAEIPAFNFYSSDFTIEGWIKPEANDGAVITALNALFGTGFDIQVSVFQTLRFIYRNPPGNAGGQAVFSTTNVIGAWHHFAAVYTTDNRLKLYIDGVLEGTSAPISPLGDGALTTFHLGFNVPTSPRFFEGAMDEFRVWDRELCEDEIQARLNCELTGNEDGLLAYYNFNQGVAGGDNASETILLDQSGNGNNGTLSNFALNGAASNWVAPGAVATGANCTTTPNCGVPPSIVCPTNIVVPNDPGQCNAVVNFAATDDAGVPPSVITYSQNPGTTFPVGTTTVTATATNTLGSDACSFKVTVNDNEAPQPVCRNTTVFLEAVPDGPMGQYTGEYQLTDDDVLDFAASFDNCGITGVTGISPAGFDCDDLGTTQPVTVTVTDVNGNSSTCTANITVEQADDLPTGWSGQDVDNGNGSNYTFGDANGDHSFLPCDGLGGTYNLSSTGPTGTQFNSGPNDQLHAVNKAFCGPGEFIAHLASLEIGAVAGIEFRESMDEGARKIGLKIFRKTFTQYFVLREVRATTNGPVQVKQFPVLANQHHWLRLVRTINPYNGFQQYSLWTSFNGQTWQPPHFFLTGAVNMQLPTCIEAALAVNGTVPFQTRSAAFDDVQLLMSGAGQSIDTGLPTTTLPTPDRKVGVYPNPARNEAFIDLGDYFGQAVDIRVFDLTGRALEFIQLDQVELAQERLDLSSYRPGAYLIRVQTGDGEVRTTRLVVH